jgi:hypothetical protein
MGLLVSQVGAVWVNIFVIVWEGKMLQLALSSLTIALGVLPRRGVAWKPIPTVDQPVFNILQT